MTYRNNGKEILYINKIIGVIFWNVNKIKQLYQDNPSITSGNQKWKGAAPILVIKAELKIIKDKLFIQIVENILDIEIIENMRIVEAKAWAIKYFIAASDE